MTHIPAMFSKESLTFYVKGVPYSAHESLATYQDLKAKLRQSNPDVDRLIALVTPAKAIEDAVIKAEGKNYLPAGTVSVSRSEVRFNGEPMEGVLVDRILSMLEEGFNIMPMVRFLENVQQNPTDFARDELYLWLENSDLPITEDGHFLAYKKVKADFTSIYDGKTKNDVGTEVSMPRHDVDTVRDNTCSRCQQLSR